MKFSRHALPLRTGFLAVAALVVLAAGCGNSGSTRGNASGVGKAPMGSPAQQVKATIREYFTAIASRDGQTACRLADPAWQADLIAHSGQTCQKAAVAGVTSDVAATLRNVRFQYVRIRGDRAVVRRPGYVLTYLQRENGTWLITTKSSSSRAVGTTSSPPESSSPASTPGSGSALGKAANTIIQQCITASYGSPFDKAAVRSAVNTVLRAFSADPNTPIPPSAGFKATNIRQLLRSVQAFLNNNCSPTDAARVTEALKTLPAKTVTATTTAPAPKPASAPKPAPAPAASSSFSGNGTKSLGTINVPTASTLEWTCSRCITFGVNNNPSDSGTISIGSNAASGSSAVDAGTYHDVQVISDGNWTIKIVPG